MATTHVLTSRRMARVRGCARLLQLGVASCCDEPSWAHELLGLFEVVPGKTLQDCMSTSGQLRTGAARPPPAAPCCPLVFRCVTPTLRNPLGLLGSNPKIPLSNPKIPLCLDHSPTCAPPFGLRAEPPPFRLPLPG